MKRLLPAEVGSGASSWSPDLPTQRTAQWMRNWLGGHTQRVAVNSSMSGLAPVTSSVPTGAILGLVLFNISVSVERTKSHHRVQVPSEVYTRLLGATSSLSINWAPGELVIRTAAITRSASGVWCDLCVLEDCEAWTELPWYRSSICPPWTKRVVTSTPAGVD